MSTVLLAIAIMAGAIVSFGLILRFLKPKPRPWQPTHDSGHPAALAAATPAVIHGPDYESRRGRATEAGADDGSGGTLHASRPDNVGSFHRDHGHGHVSSESAGSAGGDNGGGEGGDGGH